ncbi:putative membrane protein [Clostridium botulinum 202F]|nr:putative membrane protein [Clostridium botulinum 202F]
MLIVLKIIGALLAIMFIMGISIIIIMFAKILKEILNTKF